MSSAKRNSLALLALALMLILVIAMALPGLKLSPGQPFSLGKDQPGGTGGYGISAEGDLLIWILRGVIGLVLIFLPVYVVFSLMTPEGRRRLLGDITLIVILFLISEFLSKLPLKGDSSDEYQGVSMPQSLDQLEDFAPTAVFSSSPPDWLTGVVILVGAIIISLMMIVLIKYLHRKNEPPKTALQKLGDEAQNALETLQAGGDFNQTIIRCYMEMSRVVKEEKGISRATNTTPREFEAHLIGKGLPEAPIKTITRLFEQVRYGNISISNAEESTAVTSLKEFAEACISFRESHEN